MAARLADHGDDVAVVAPSPTGRAYAEAEGRRWSSAYDRFRRGTLVAMPCADPARGPRAAARVPTRDPPRPEPLRAGPGNDAGGEGPRHPDRRDESFRSGEPPLARAGPLAPNRDDAADPVPCRSPPS